MCRAVVTQQLHVSGLAHKRGCVPEMSAHGKLPAVSMLWFKFFFGLQILKPV